MKIKAWFEFEKNDLVDRIRNYSKLRLFLLLAAAFGFFISIFSTWQKTTSSKLLIFDDLVLNLVSLVKTEYLVEFFGLITLAGNEWFISLAFIILIIVLAVVRRKRAATVSLVSYLGSLSFLYFLRNFFARLRPFGCLNNGDCLSYPSGHATLAVYFYGLLNYLILRFLPVSWKVYLVINFLLIGLVFLIVISRLFLNAHYPSDLIAGIFLGGAWLMVAIFLIDVLY